MVAGKGFLLPHLGMVSSTSVLTVIFRVPSKYIEEINGSLFLIPVAKWSQLALTNSGLRCFEWLLFIASVV